MEHTTSAYGLWGLVIANSLLLKRTPLSVIRKPNCNPAGETP